MDKDKRKELPEAKSSVTYSVTTKDGFNALFTVRDDSGSTLLKAMELIEKELVDKGYKPQVRYSKQAPKEKDWLKTPCPKCGNRVYHVKTKTGKEFDTCENRKWDFSTSKNVGTCDYIKWKDDEKKEDSFKDDTESEVEEIF